jgi:hypothetical protein
MRAAASGPQTCKIAMNVDLPKRHVRVTSSVSM